LGERTGSSAFVATGGMPARWPAARGNSLVHQRLRDNPPGRQYEIVQAALEAG